MSFLWSLGRAYRMPKSQRRPGRSKFSRSQISYLLVPTDVAKLFPLGFKLKPWTAVVRGIPDSDTLFSAAPRTSMATTSQLLAPGRNTYTVAPSFEKPNRAQQLGDTDLLS